MNFIADLHIHSRFSMATSKQLTVPHLAGWAMRKGIDVLGSGDFTHPQWREELRENLLYDEESGLYRCKENILAAEDTGALRARFDRGPFFCLQAEISSIYKRGGKVRKIHNLVFAPNLEAADRISRRLGLIGNLSSDGRPIIGLDSHDLLEIALECSCLLVPAHIWTPWFSLFGSKSGFDRIEDCFGDLTEHIFALETGLSSDPPMNRCLSALDNYALISNSDAHSGANLGREANLFAGFPSWDGMFAALRQSARGEEAPDSSCRFLGTMEFYPEEGKYHLDGHRACNISLSPAESARLNNVCPICGKPLTIGVLHRVMELADREKPASPPHEPEARMLVPLAEVIAAILGAGTNSRKVGDQYRKVLNSLGPELNILCQMPLARIRAFWEPLGEAVERIRHGKVSLEPGYDGQYGVIRIFTPEETAEFKSGGSILAPARHTPQAAPEPRHLDLDIARQRVKNQDKTGLPCSAPQNEAINAGPEPVLVLAGPGAGKTRVLVGRMKKLLENGQNDLLALTFTRRAAEEMRQRLNLANHASQPICDTMHSLAWRLLNEREDKNVSPQAVLASAAPRRILLDEDAAERFFCDANKAAAKEELRKSWQKLALARETIQPLSPELRSMAQNYSAAKQRDPHIHYLDYTDLLEWLLEHAPEYAERWQHVLVDEVQDLSPLQLALLRALLPADGTGFFGIGDPDQSIYEFRGASGLVRDELASFWPRLKILHLNESYRASQKILDMAGDVLGGSGQCGRLRAIQNFDAELRILAAENEHAEARLIADRIRLLLGATSHSLLDAGRQADGMRASLAPSDIAVLVRLKAQLSPLRKALEEAGVPCAAPAAQEFWRDGQCALFLDYARSAAPSAAPAIFLDNLAHAGLDAPANPAAPDVAVLRASSAFAELCGFWNQCGSWDNFFTRLAWLHEAEMISAKAQCVRLLTIHASKGLEFQAVFLPGLEDGILPLKRNLLFGNDGEDRSGQELAGEKRLLYVGITRAARAVFASYCARRSIFGKTFNLAPSPFLPILKDFCKQTRRVRRNVSSEEFLSLF